MFYPGFFDLMKLQGNVRIKLMKMGLSEDLSFDCANEVLHIFATSDIVRSDIRQNYEASLKQKAADNGQ